MNRIAFILLLISVQLVRASEVPSLELLGARKIASLSYLTTRALQSLNDPVKEKVRDALITRCRDHFKKPNKSKQVHDGGINDVVICDSGAIFSVGEDGYVHRTRFESDATNSSIFYSPDRKEQALLSLAIGNDVLATGGNDHSIKIYENSKLKHCIVGAHSGGIEHLELWQNEEQLISAGTNAIKIWDINSGKQCSQLQPHGNPETVLASNGSLLVTAGWDGNCNVYDSKQKEPACTQSGLDAVRVVTITHDGKKVGLGNLSGLVRIWDLAAGTIEELVDYKQPITSLSFNKTGTQLLVNSGTKPIGLYDVQSMQELGAIAEHFEFAKSAQFNPHNDQITIGTGRGVIEQWELPDYQGQTLEELLQKAQKIDVWVKS